MSPARAADPRRRLAAGGLALAIAIGAGYALAAWRSAEARTRLENSNRHLRESLGTLAEGLREARRPLQRRIHQLESALTARATVPGDELERPGRSEPRGAEPGNAALAARVLELEAELSELRIGHAEGAAAPDGLAAEHRRVVSHVAGLEARARSAAGPRLPSVAAAPPTIANSSCQEGGDRAFDLRDLAAPLDELDGRLTLRFRQETSGLSLALGDHADEGFPLDSLPQHVAFDCEGVPYVISICEASPKPPHVRGVIWQSSVWHDHCD